MEIKFSAMAKSFNKKALVSGDYNFELKLWGHDPNMAGLIATPADKEISVVVSWE